MHIREMNQGLSISPTAKQYSEILDNFTALKGVPKDACGTIGERK
jgi:hypothetical protein